MPLQNTPWGDRFAQLFGGGGSNGRTYGVDVGSAHLALLDSTASLGDQAAWLEADLTAAQQQFDTALALFDRIGDPGMVAFLHNLLAEDSRHLGQTHESWRHFDQALSRLDALDSIRDVIPVLSSAANACLTDEMPGSALLFFEAIRQESLATGNNFV